MNDMIGKSWRWMTQENMLLNFAVVYVILSMTNASLSLLIRSARGMAIGIKSCTIYYLITGDIKYCFFIVLKGITTAHYM